LTEHRVLIGQNI